MFGSEFRVLPYLQARSPGWFKWVEQQERKLRFGEESEYGGGQDREVTGG